jgi:subtilase family serine protease
MASGKVRVGSLGALAFALASLVVATTTTTAPAAPAAPAPGVAIGAAPRWATPAADLGHLANQRIGHMTVLLSRTPDRERAFEALRAAQDTPGSPSYHHWLTAQQLGDQFGAGDADVAAVTSWLRGQGLEVVRVSRSRTFVEVRGTTAAAEAAFGVQLHRYRVNGTTLRAPDRAPTVPAALAGVVRGVTGLVDAHPVPQHVRPAAVGSNGDHFVGVSDFATIYDLAPVYADGIDGSGQTIAIIGRSRVVADDITNFGAREGVTLAALTTIIPPMTGVDPGAPCADDSCNGNASIDDQAEATLDVQRVTSIATGAKVELVTSASDNMGDDGIAIAIEFEVDSFGVGADANIITMSFGLCEDDLQAAGVQSVDQLYQQAATRRTARPTPASSCRSTGCARARRRRASAAPSSSTP